MRKSLAGCNTLTPTTDPGSGSAAENCGWCIKGLEGERSPGAGRVGGEGRNRRAPRESQSETGLIRCLRKRRRGVEPERWSHWAERGQRVDTDFDFVATRYENVFRKIFLSQQRGNI